MVYRIRTELGMLLQTQSALSKLQGSAGTAACGFLFEKHDPPVSDADVLLLNRRDYKST